MLHRVLITSCLAIMLAVLACGSTSVVPETLPLDSSSLGIVPPSASSSPSAEVTPTSTPVYIYSESDSGSQSFELQMPGGSCEYEYFERVQFVKGDRFEISVTSGNLVSVLLKLPDGSRQTFGESDRVHDIVYTAEEPGRYTIIIAAAWAYNPIIMCHQRTAPVEYKYTVYGRQEAGPSSISRIRSGEQSVWTNKGSEAETLLVTLQSSQGQLEDGESAVITASANNLSESQLDVGLIFQTGTGLMVSSQAGCTGNPEVDPVFRTGG